MSDENDGRRFDQAGRHVATYDERGRLVWAARSNAGLEAAALYPGPAIGVTHRTQTSGGAIPARSARYVGGEL